MFGFSSEVNHEDVVIQVVCRIPAVVAAKGQGGDLFSNRAIRIGVDERHLVTLCVGIWEVASEFGPYIVALVDDARILHLLAGRWLKINLPRSQNPLKE